ncbi:MAG: hypothetical protein SFT94_05860 [Pseudanabaenaceae cyanobacterium bins.68]|nr:hypothetical protein [Pseudanabaenaceae cyanobacterium bins.68]
MHLPSDSELLNGYDRYTYGDDWEYLDSLPDYRQVFKPEHLKPGYTEDF